LAETALILRWTIALLLLYAGVVKARDVPAFRASLTSYRILPGTVVAPASFLVPATELLLGLLLLSGLALKLAAAAATVLFAAFLAVQLVSFVRGISPPCHCFSSNPLERVTPSTIVRTLLLSVLTATLVALPETTGLGAGHVMPLAPVAVGLALVVRSMSFFSLILSSFGAPARLAATPTWSRRVSYRDAGLEATLRPQFIAASERRE
jgi:uncharacterized membrane protein YphA (DoxX/SURF4 family)